MLVQPSAFVVHAFTPDNMEHLRSTIDSALSDSGFGTLYADDELAQGHILDDKIQRQIDRSDFCLVEISDQDRSSVFVEYGYAKGIGKPCVLLLRKSIHPPADLEGYDRIEYENWDDLSKQLRGYITHIRTLIARAGFTADRVALICSTTSEIESDSVKTEALARFYGHLFDAFMRTPLAINTCGAEPLRGAFLRAYGDKLLSWSAEQMRAFQPKIRWYWHSTAQHGFGFHPPCFESFKAADRESRTIDEALGSSAIVAFLGRTGTREQVERLLSYHENGNHELDLRERPLILLAWFGGSIADLLGARRDDLRWLLNTYNYLNPEVEFNDWTDEERAKRLARELVTGVQRVLTSSRIPGIP